MGLAFQKKSYCSANKFSDKELGGTADPCMCLCPWTAWPWRWLRVAGPTDRASLMTRHWEEHRPSSQRPTISVAFWSCTLWSRQKYRLKFSPWLRMPPGPSEFLCLSEPVFTSPHGSTYPKLWRLCSLTKSEPSLNKNVVESHTSGFRYWSFLNNRRGPCGAWVCTVKRGFPLYRAGNYPHKVKHIYRHILFETEVAGCAPPPPHLLLASSRDSKERQTFF